ncbi:S8 family peptidase [Bacillus velezensis]|uniref:S8 family peptidase n=1 Tax=Bacillus velezensis TaxID=492670 RepID=UPI0018C65B53|nr:S8 family peptidase [Bacillus velezensis]QPK89892.1 S8 family peptidase [Bacillus velezensis]
MKLKKEEVFDQLIDNTDWGIKAIKADQVWDKTKGAGVKILVIDTGIDMDHPDLKHSFKLGINMFEQSRDVTDIYGHGTHVAGLIAGKYTGVAPEADLYIAKVLNDKGRGSMASVMDGITFAMNMKIDVLCMSLGVPDELPIIVRERIAQANQSGISIVCATGNDGRDDADYPAHMDEVIAVGGLDRSLNISSFSNGGYDVLAPSVDIFSTYKNGKYAKMTGTSMASPLVAGGIALLISYYRNKGLEINSKDIKNLVNGNFDLTTLIP